MTRAINDPGNEDPGSCWKPTPTPCSAVPPPGAGRALPARSPGLHPRVRALPGALHRVQQGTTPARRRLRRPLPPRRPATGAPQPMGAGRLRAGGALCPGMRGALRWRRAAGARMCGCLPALRRGLSAVVAGLRLATFCPRAVESECAGQADFLACPGFSFRLPRRVPLQASVRTGDIADRCAGLPGKDHERRHEPERGVHFEVLIRRANNATGVIRRCRG